MYEAEVLYWLQTLLIRNLLHRDYALYLDSGTSSRRWTQNGEFICSHYFFNISPWPVCLYYECYSYIKLSFLVVMKYVSFPNKPSIQTKVATSFSNDENSSDEHKHIIRTCPGSPPVTRKHSDHPIGTQGEWGDVIVLQRSWKYTFVISAASSTILVQGYIPQE